MKRTALILAGAAAFDLGVMAVAAQAGQQAQIPPIRTTSTGPTIPDPASGAAAAPVWDENGTTDCTNSGRPGTAGRPTSCGPAAISDQAAQGNLSAVMPTAGGDRPIGHKEQRVTHIKIDLVNTIQSCRARQGEVVRHQGAQQCRIPPPPPAAVGNPSLPRPGGIPPRN